MPPRPRSMVLFSEAAETLGNGTSEAELVELTQANLLRGDVRLYADGWWMAADVMGFLANGGLAKVRTILANRKLREAA